MRLAFRVLIAVIVIVGWAILIIRLIDPVDLKPCRFVDGEVPALGTATYCEGNGEQVFLRHFLCKDGTLLVSVREPTGWYVPGRPFHATVGSHFNDPAYQAVLDECLP